ncbi:MAG TPA: hypothetical protein PLL26_00670 [Candidatus Dojkabacteria bacterium]|nr:hypothetical protein [Candidatus Dojkabacteria bacterium]
MKGSDISSLGYKIDSFSYLADDQTLVMQVVHDAEGNDLYILTVHHPVPRGSYTRYQVLG